LAASDIEDHPFHRIVIRIGQNMSRYSLGTQDAYLKSPGMSPSDDAEDPLMLLSNILDRQLLHQNPSLLHKDVKFELTKLDVQMTRDHVHVIYHDFLLSESGADLAPHNVTLDQVLAAYPTRQTL
jgi:hypothetical protein